jgi:hypothetical protein
MAMISRATIETDILEIEYAASDTYNRTSSPDLGIVKFFKDDAGHYWAKWNLRPGVYGGTTKITHLVIPVKLIRAIHYEGHAALEKS